MINTRYLIDPSGIIPEWIADNRDICDPRECNDYRTGDDFAYLSSVSIDRRQDTPMDRLVLVGSSDTDDSRCIGIRHRNGVRSWSLVE
jgi:hypothetical protein